MATDPSLSRRALLGRLAMGLGALACQGPQLAWARGQPAERAVYVGVETSGRTGLSRAQFFAASGARLGVAPLTFRAHGMTLHGNDLVVFPRRPGDRFAVIDRTTLEIKAVVAAPAGRRFCGHGALTRDGRRLLVTENDLETLGGALGLYELTPGGGAQRLGRVDLPLPGPHDIARAPGRDVFFVAIGGLETHPAYGRTPLNLSTFRSEVVAVDMESARPDGLGDWPGSDGVSLRHLAWDDAGRLYVGGQVVDARRAKPECVLWVADAGRVSQVAAGAQLRGYVSSVAAEGRKALVTSAEASVAIHLDGTREISASDRDGASAAAMAPGVVAQSGYSILAINGREVPVEAFHEFDNHGLALR